MPRHHTYMLTRSFRIVYIVQRDRERERERNRQLEYWVSVTVWIYIYIDLRTRSVEHRYIYILSCRPTATSVSETRYRETSYRFYLFTLIIHKCTRQLGIYIYVRLQSLLICYICIMSRRYVGDSYIYICNQIDVEKRAHIYIYRVVKVLWAGLIYTLRQLRIYI